eukprot:CAMPEP_0206166990 /NCGR_PEP_ID=MMETSP1474-20131121/26276_1 /ASSEMBLY_ACC=CAM_ASM_001110 /TAXON_ID=97495 /ORGANISM="Imantonia sp., Strain RCC918" /LENGTH=45 /DNA_ID= /DNA_START= /DNA_END= /DNA_ORIENTATION=
MAAFSASSSGRPSMSSCILIELATSSANERSVFGASFSSTTGEEP